MWIIIAMNTAFGGAKTKFYILVKLKNNMISNRLDERRRVLLKGNSPSKDMLHITLLEGEINPEHHKSSFFNNLDMNIIGKFYSETFKKYQVKLKYCQGKYDLLGQTKNKFLVKIYNVPTENNRIITHFRKKFYQYLESKLGRMKITDNSKNNGYAIFELDGKPLLAIPSYYYGIGKWTPHISIVNTADVKLYNKDLYGKYESKIKKSDQIQALLEPIYEKRFSPIGDINMSRDIESLIFSVSKDDYVVKL